MPQFVGCYIVVSDPHSRQVFHATKTYVTGIQDQLPRVLYAARTLSSFDAGWNRLAWVLSRIMLEHPQISRWSSHFCTVEEQSRRRDSRSTMRLPFTVQCTRDLHQAAPYQRPPFTTYLTCANYAWPPEIDLRTPIISGVRAYATYCLPGNTSTFCDHSTVQLIPSIC